MKKIFLIFLSTFSVEAFAVEIQSLDFKVEKGISKFSVQADGELNYTQEEFADENQFVLNFSDATLSARAKRRLDTSSFDSPVTMISPYQIEDENEQVRIVIQLRNSSPVNVKNLTKGLEITIGTEGLAQKSTDSFESSDDSSDTDLAEASDTPSSASPVEDSAAQDVQTYISNKEKQNFTGKPITLQVKDADVTDVLRLISEASGFNVIVSAGVTGKLTLSLIEVPWDQVLDVVLQTLKLGAERNNNILRVMTLTEMTQQKQEQLQAKIIAEASAPRITKVFPISYADLAALQTVLSTFGKTTSTTGTTIPVQPPLVQTDSRTNSIIVQDIPDNVERMKKLIEILDKPTPQVLVEAKIVEASESFSKSLGGSLGLGFGGSSNVTSVASFSGANPVDALIGSPGVFADGSAVATASSQAGTLGASPTISFLPGVQRLNALLSIGESEQQVKVVSAPKLVVLHKETATILQNTPVIIESTVATSTATTTQKQVQPANVSLNVTPTVTNDDSVLLTLRVSRDVPQSTSAGPAVANRNMDTKVLVDSGTTLVIGGIYTLDNTSSGSGFPFLRKIPLLGTLFGTESSSTARSELFVFVTPKILSPRKPAG